MRAPMVIEREVKFSLPAGQAQALDEAPCLRRAACSPVQRRRVVSTYYDTPQQDLRRAGAALRVRSDGARREQTLKVAAPGPAGMQNCEEWTVVPADAGPDLGAFDDAALARFGDGARSLALEPLFTTDVERATRQLQHGETGIEMSVDLGRIHTHGESAATLAVSEVEFELLGGSPRELFAFLIELLETVELHPLHPSKAERGYRLAQPDLDTGAAKARDVALDRRMTVGAAFQRISGEALRHLLGNLEATGAGRAEALHQSRVAIRRIRAALYAFRGVLPRQARREFNDAFRQLQGTLSPPRDWHVFSDESLATMAADGAAGRRAIERLHAVADDELARHLQQAAAALQSRECTRLLLTYQGWLLRLEEQDDAALGGKLRPFARQVLDASRRDLVADPRPLARMHEEERHDLRKRGKKARYATEFFSGLWHGGRVTRYVKLMARLQDQLGLANDAVIARQLIAAVEAPSLKASDRRKVEAWARRRERQCIKAAQPVWRRVRRLEPFWHGRSERRS